MLFLFVLLFRDRGNFSFSLAFPTVAVLVALGFEGGFPYYSLPKDIGNLFRIHDFGNIPNIFLSITNGQIDKKYRFLFYETYWSSTVRKYDGTLVGRFSVLRQSVCWIPIWHRLWIVTPHQVTHFYQFTKKCPFSLSCSFTVFPAYHF